MQHLPHDIHVYTGVLCVARVNTCRFLLASAAWKSERVLFLTRSNSPIFSRKRKRHLVPFLVAHSQGGDAGMEA